MTPPGSAQIVLQEAAAKTFVTDKRYKSDLRYLKVLIQYVRLFLCRTPLLVVELTRSAKFLRKHAFDIMSRPSNVEC